MRQRILAIVAAVALVAVAFVARSVIADDGGSDGSGGGGSKPVVACTPDLAAVCAALAADGSIADDPPTLDLDGAATPAADIDGWITWDPAPGIANLDADQAGQAKPWGSGQALGSSQLAVSLRATGSGGFPEGCTEVAFAWTCLVEAATASPPQPIGVGTGLTAESLARIYPIANALLPSTDDGFDQVDRSAIRALVTSYDGVEKTFKKQFDRMRAAPAIFDFVVGPVDAMRDKSGILIVEPKGSASAVVAFAPRTTQAADLLDDAFGSDRVTKALRDAGVAPGTGKLSPDDRAGDLYAVRKKVG